MDKKQPIVWHWWKWMHLPIRCLRTLGKRGNIKVVISIFIVLMTTASLQSFRGFIKHHHLKSTNVEEGNDPLPDSNFPESVVTNDAMQDQDIKNITWCKRLPSSLVGNISPNQNITPTFEEVENVSGTDLMEGGCFVPTSCKPRQKVAIIIPFKDRDAHLKTLMYYLHPMLQRQKAQYCLYVAEQVSSEDLRFCRFKWVATLQFDNGTFNKAMVMNAAFEEVMKLDSYDCIVFHDVDMIPENDNNLYACAKYPRHLSPAIDKFKYRPHYGTDFGGVTAITPEQYRKANGHSNTFWGWGGEDNDMEFRIRYNGMKILASPLTIGRYKMIPHGHSGKFKIIRDSYQLNKTQEKRAKVDGLLDLMYRMKETERFSTFTKLMIDIRRIEVKAITLFIDGKPNIPIDVDPAGPCRWMELPGLTLSDHIRESRDSYDSMPFAMLACKNLESECGGVVKERNNESFSVHPRRSPRNDEGYLRNIILEIGMMPGGGLLSDLVSSGVTYNVVFGHPDNPLQPDVPSPDGSKSRTYMQYCPDPGASFQMFPDTFKVEVSSDIPSWVKANKNSNFSHFYAFEIELQIYRPPSGGFYYHDKMYFESQLKTRENIFFFHLSNSNPQEDSSSDTPRQYEFKTNEFPIPNIPGIYSVQSEILDRSQHPHFQWNWWFEVKSDNKTMDAMAREEFWRKLIGANIVDPKLISQQTTEGGQRNTTSLP